MLWIMKIQIKLNFLQYFIHNIQNKKNFQLLFYIYTMRNRLHFAIF